MSKLPSTFEVEIEKLVFGGEGLGYFDNKPVFVYGVLPGEVVRVSPAKKNRRFIKARLEEVLEPNPLRREPQDKSYLSTSPWQVMDIVTQRQEKVRLVKELFGHAKVEIGLEPDITGGESFGYRNKMEFSVKADNTGKLQLAFHERYRWNRHICVDAVTIAHPEINRIAAEVLKALNDRAVKPADIKNLLVRYSYAAKSLVAVLYVMNEDFESFDFTSANLSGWGIVYSDPRSPMAKTTKLLFDAGSLDLTESLGGVDLTYHYESFFQVNPPVFEDTLEDIRSVITGGVVADLYAGCGTIGFALADKFRHLRTIELDKQAVELARHNALQNGLGDKAEITGGFVEKQDLPEVLKGLDCLIIDPPRAGLHDKVIEEILAAKPRQLVYLSCGPDTQARDWIKLQEAYKARFWRLYDYYPQTPHVESLIVADLA